jgi:hypothetical protein
MVDIPAELLSLTGLTNLVADGNTHPPRPFPFFINLSKSL